MLISITANPARERSDGGMAILGLRI